MKSAGRVICRGRGDGGSVFCLDGLPIQSSEEDKDSKEQYLRLGKPKKQHDHRCEYAVDQRAKPCVQSRGHGLDCGSAQRILLQMRLSEIVSARTFRNGSHRGNYSTETSAAQFTGVTRERRKARAPEAVLER